MQLPDRVALGTTFLVERPLPGLVAALEAAFVALEVDAAGDGPYAFLCRALREHQIVVLYVAIFNQNGKILVSLRRCAGDRPQSVQLANELAAAAGLRGPVVAPPKHLYEPDAHDAARYLTLLGGDFKAKMEGLCAAAAVRALKTGEGRELVERVAQVGLCDDPLLRLTALSAAVSMVRQGADARLFEAAARLGLADQDPLARIQARHLL